MCRSIEKWCAAGLLLLYAGSFILHIFVHNPPSCSGNSAPQTLPIPVPSIRTMYDGLSTGSGYPVAAVFPSRNPGSGICDDLFCPICAGWLTADCPVRQEISLLICGNPEFSPVFSSSISTPSWLLPSPRAPPAA